MLQPLPPGFPTPDPRDPEPIARDLGKASALWMRGAYADAAAKVEEIARRASELHAEDPARIDATRVASLLRVSAALGTLVEEMTARGVTDPASIPISLEFDTADLTSSELIAVQSMEIASTDLESVHVEPPVDEPAKPPVAPPKLPPRPPRALATTMQQVSRPTIPDPPKVVMVPEGNVSSAQTIDLRRTLPQGIRDPRVAKPTPRPFPQVNAPDEKATPSSGVLPLSDPFKDLDVPSSELAATTNPIPFGAKYPPSEAEPSAKPTRRAPDAEAEAEGESTDPAPEPKK